MRWCQRSLAPCPSRLATSSQGEPVIAAAARLLALDKRTIYQVAPEAFHRFRAVRLPVSLFIRPSSPTSDAKRVGGKAPFKAAHLWIERCRTGGTPIGCVAKCHTFDARGYGCGPREATTVRTPRWVSAATRSCKKMPVTSFSTHGRSGTRAHEPASARKRNSGNFGNGPPGLEPETDGL